MLEFSFLNSERADFNGNGVLGGDEIKPIYEATHKPQYQIEGLSNEDLRDYLNSFK